MWRHRYLLNKVHSVATTTFCCVSCRYFRKLARLLLLKKAKGSFRATCADYDYRIIITITDKALPPFRLRKSILSLICVVHNTKYNTSSKIYKIYKIYILTNVHHSIFRHSLCRSEPGYCQAFSPRNWEKYNKMSYANLFSREKHGSYCKDFRENFNCRVLLKIVNKSRVWLKWEF
jgi:hypothetical protein